MLSIIFIYIEIIFEMKRDNYEEKKIKRDMLLRKYC
jgi:hypothetical protein